MNVVKKKIWFGVRQIDTMEDAKSIKSYLMMMFVNFLRKKMKIDNIVIRGACINGEHHWVVYFYDNSGNEMEKNALPTGQMQGNMQ